MPTPATCPDLSLNQRTRRNTRSPLTVAGLTLSERAIANWSCPRQAEHVHVAQAFDVGFGIARWHHAHLHWARTRQIVGSYDLRCRA
jgi:hypothetical protein